jgi:hypothetical protein
MASRLRVRKRSHGALELSGDPVLMRTARPDWTREAKVDAVD